MTGPILRYDGERHRVWIAGQRLHHGATGLALAGAGLLGVAAHRARFGIPWAMLGTVLVAHDWNDRSIWFQRGPGPQA